MSEFDFDVVSDLSDLPRRRPPTQQPPEVTSRTRDDTNNGGQSVVMPERSGPARP